ncbi:hypothetical protein [Hymenobacter coccineus]|uniref:hypothetical protein n=1 Tax=Hymenobacter coccineus TaxID=1908235 RepID=UPI000F7AB053|nr:hypothetical protein [Hymenobacter coccineus]
MGYKFALQIPVNQLSQRLPNGDDVLRCFETRVALPLTVIDRQPATGSYAFGNTIRKQWPEDFVIKVDERECYVIFHVASVHQSVVLSTLSSCLLAAGVTGVFDEL